MKITMFKMKDTLDRIIRVDTMEIKIMELETSVVKTSLKVQKQSPSLVWITGSKY